MDNADRDVVLHDDGVEIPVKGAAGDGANERAVPHRLLEDVLCYKGRRQAGVDDTNIDVVLHDDRVGIPIKGAAGDGGNERAAPRRLLQGRLGSARWRGVQDGRPLLADGSFEIQEAAALDGRDDAGWISSC